MYAKFRAATYKSYHSGVYWHLNALRRNIVLSLWPILLISFTKHSGPELHTISHNAPRISSPLIHWNKMCSILLEHHGIIAQHLIKIPAVWQLGTSLLLHSFLVSKYNILHCFTLDCVDFKLVWSHITQFDHHLWLTFVTLYSYLLIKTISE